MILCDVCQATRAKFQIAIENRIHSLCSRRCARNAVACQAGCGNPARVDNNGRHLNYCGTCYNAYVEVMCRWCSYTLMMPTSLFCSQQCEHLAEESGPRILEVPLGHEIFKSVTNQFKKSWRHTNAVCPPVRHVYKIFTPAHTRKRYDNYMNKVEARSGLSKGNENRRWHGTRRVCNVGDAGQTRLCSLSECFLCCVIWNSFDISFWKINTGGARFGPGIYASSTSSKSDTYSENFCRSSLKALLLNNVIVGRGYKLYQGVPLLAAPPDGFDSVLGEVGEALNYDELVVYTNDAIRPRYLVMYEP